MLTHIIAIANEKGGAAKTTTTAAMASILASKGFKTICIDTDKQGDLGISFQNSSTTVNLYDILMKKQPLQVHPINDNLGIIPATGKLRNFERHLKDEFPRIRHEEILRNAIEPLRGKCDFMLIDCPPDLDALIVENAFVAADYVLIPANPHPYSVAGIETVLRIIKELNVQYNPSLKALGILITQFRNTVLHNDMVNEIDKAFPGLMLNSKIRQNITMEEVTTTGIEIVNYDKEKLKHSKVKILKDSNCLIDYTYLCGEVLNKIQAS